MSFDTTKICAEIVGVIDIGSSKIRVGICSIKNREVSLLGYAEKRQDEGDVIMQEIKNPPRVCENILLAIKKAESDAGIETQNIIINTPTSEIFMEFNQINHIRENPHTPIEKQELYDIMKSIEEKSLKKHYKVIKHYSGYNSNDIRLIISNINEISLDRVIKKQLFHETGKELSISLSNIFIPEENYEFSEYLQVFTNKNILQVIPIEYSLSTLFSKQEEVVIIDIGSSHTSIIVKIKGKIIGTKKLIFGMNDLIKQIQGQYNLSKIHIINQIDSSNFEKEKTVFLNIFQDILSISLGDILQGQICPHNFFMTGGGANIFIKDFLKQVNLNKEHLKMVKSIRFISPKIDILGDIDDAWVEYAKSNINIYSMISATLDFIKKDKSNVEKVLKEVIQDII